MPDYKSIAFLPLDLPKLDVPYEKILKHFDTSIKDNYRNCRHIPLIVDKPGERNSKEHLKETKQSHDFPEIMDYLKQHVQPWMINLPRTMIISTPPGVKNHIHIDCAKEKFDTVQLKFRIVLQGKTETLYFLDGDKKIYAPAIGNQPFLMAGEWPHGMDNTTDNFKFTLGLGAPWECESNDLLDELIERSIDKYGCLYNNFSLPENHEKYFMD